jgi:hypothetical protein
VIVVFFAFLCDFEEVLRAFEEVSFCYLGLESFRADKWFRVITAGKTLRFGRADKRLLDGRSTCKRSSRKEGDYGMHLDDFQVSSPKGSVVRRK